MVSVLDQEYSTKPQYFPYWDRLGDSLKANGVANLQEKMADAQTIGKFRSVVSELEFANALALRGKRIVMIVDDAWPGQSPDMVSKDEFGEVYIEVTCFTDSGVLDMMVEKLKSFLVGKPCRVEVAISTFLFTPRPRPLGRQGPRNPEDRARERREREEERARRRAAKASVEQFEKGFQGSGRFELTTEHAKFTATKIADPDGYATITGFGNISDGAFAQKLEDDAFTKASKRSSWLPSAPQIPYVLAFDSEEIQLDSDTMDITFFGIGTLDPNRHQPDVSDHPKVRQALHRGWRQCLERMGMIYNTTNDCYIPYDRPGLFLTVKKMFNHVGGILLRIDREFSFRPNPFCDYRMNNPTFEGYLPKAFYV